MPIKIDIHCMVHCIVSVEYTTTHAVYISRIHGALEMLNLLLKFCNNNKDNDNELTGSFEHFSLSYTFVSSHLRTHVNGKHIKHTKSSNSSNIAGDIFISQAKSHIASSKGDEKKIYTHIHIHSVSTRE